MSEQERKGYVRKETTRRYRVDPRIALLVLVPLNVEVTLYPHLGYQVASMSIVLLLMVVCRRPTSALRWSVAYASTFAFAHLSSMAGWGWLSSPASMFLMFQRVLPVAAFAAVCLATTHSGEFVCALQKMGFSSKLTVSLCVALRFVPTLAREFKAVGEAMRIRGMVSSPLAVATHPASTVEHLMVPVIGRVGIIADELGNAVVARGADTARERSSYYALRIQAADILLLMVEYALFAAMLLARMGVTAP